MNNDHPHTVLQVEIDGADTHPPGWTGTLPSTKGAPSSLPHIPGFHLESELGRGGMGVVYLARQVRLNRLVALKMILSGDHANEETKLRFLAEAEAIAKLNHPGIVQVHEFGTHDNNPYFALEYISGGSLDKKLAGNPLPPREAADLVEKLARAVQSAHDAGIIHRDLKSANILLGSPSSSMGEGSGVRGSTGFAPKITDFGLVKNIGSNMTATGQILGTPSYMAPEQADGKKSVGPTADVYSLGAILYESLTGRAPFKAATPLDTLLQVLNDEPVSVSQLQAKTPMDLETICHKCLQKEPGKRYGSAAELADDLGRYLRHELIAARPVGRMEKTTKWIKRNRTVTISAVLIVAALLIGICLSLWQANRAFDEINRTKRLRSLQAVTHGIQLIENNDRFIGLLWLTQPFVMASGHQDVERMTRQRLAAYRLFEQQRVYWAQAFTHKESVTDANFSSDGRFVVTASRDKTVLVWETASGKVVSKPFVHPANVINASFSPDNTRVITVAEDNNARLWDVSTGKLLTTPFAHRSTISQASFSDDGTRIITASADRKAKVWDAISGNEVHEELSHEHDVSQASFSPDGKYFVTSSWTTVIVRNSRTALAESTFAKHKHDNSLVSYVRFSPGGDRILSVCGSTARIWEPRSAEELTAPLVHGDMINEACFSHDGSKVLTVSADGTARIWNAKTGMQIGIPMIHPAGVRCGSFGPDDRSIVTVSDRTARVWNLTTYQMNIPLLHHTSHVYTAKYSNDGRFILTTATEHCARLWNISCIHLHSNSHPAFMINNSELSQDGKYRISGVSSSRSAIRILLAATGSPVSPPMSHQGIIRSFQFNEDSSCVITASEDKTARVWNSPTGLPITPPLRHEDKVIRACFSKDGAYLVTRTANEAMRTWDLPYDERAIKDLIHMAQVYASTTIDDSGGYETIYSDELLDWYQEMKTKYPAEFTATFEDSLRWRLQQIADSFKEHNLPAAFFHRDWLIAEMVQEAAKVKAK